MSERSTGSTTEKPKAAARAWGAVVEFVVDHPVRLAGVLAALVATHGLLTWPWPSLNLYKAFAADSNLGTVVTTYLATAAAAALVASFAGVIIVFVISAQTPQVKQFRMQAGLPLQRTWVVVVGEPFFAAFLGVVATVAQFTVGRIVAPWLFELGVVLLAHTAVRLVLLLRSLVGIVAADDEKAERAKHALSVNDIFSNAGS
jgi:ABC-type spermidine/putrescine transport system permease subunit II